MKTLRAKLVWGIKIASLFAVLSGLLIGGPFAPVRQQVEAAGYMNGLRSRTPVAMQDFGRPNWLVFPRAVALSAAYDGSGVVRVASVGSVTGASIHLNVSSSLLRTLIPSDTVLILTDTGRQRTYEMQPDDLTPDLILSSPHDELAMSFKLMGAE